LAIAGLSRSGKKFGNTLARELQGRGYQLYPIHPEATTLDGMTCYPNLTALNGKAEALIVCVPPAGSLPLLQEAARLGMENIWIQQGAESPELLKFLQENKIQAVTRKCILMYAPPVGGIHKFHRQIHRFFGKL
ncbi:MAG: CoA-binding protein, partial [Marinilabiliales bacterium]|nr:CoA-binding protein [Marinilabiliales bacterium]